ncbi:MAG TPA: OmpA family protein [Bacteroidia bacterium]|jgi:outer membrane protein OmpA-like peptidoglycan-associated protein|nr:OmpA family protein [Bacteroidia bacterium]
MFKVCRIINLFFLAPFILNSQSLTFDGNNTLDGQPLLNTTITVMESGKQIKTFNTGNQSTFKLDLPFGKNYSIYFINAKSQRMYMDVIMNNLPEKAQKINMTYAFDIPFFPKDAATFDTAQFKNPFHKVIFDGKNKMVDDTIYMKQFIAKVYLRNENVKAAVAADPKTIKWNNLAGKFSYNNKEKLPVRNKKVNLINGNGAVVKTTSTNKYGNFIFTGVNLNDARKIEIDFKKEFTNQTVSVELTNSKGEVICTNNVTNNKAECQSSATNKVIEKLIDPRFSYKISAKLIQENDKKISFYAKRTVLLLNDKNTVIRRGKTNPFGSFVFTDLKPGQTYLIGVEKIDVETGMKVNLYTNADHYIAPVDSAITSRFVRRFSADNNSVFNDLLIDESQLRMDVSGKLYGDNMNNPLGDLKILLLNDKFETIDTTTTDGFGRFIFKYIPFSKDYTITGLDDKESLLEAISNILVYNSEDEVVKIVSNFKGKRFKYNPLDAEKSKLTEIYADDPWLALLSTDTKTIRKANTIIIEDILFESGKYNLLPDARRTLEKIALVLSLTATIKIELSAHTDSNGDDASNQLLSEQRAKAAVDFMIGKGVDPARVIAKGYGETRITNRCKNGVFCTDDEHQPNRRIEFKILRN